VFATVRAGRLPGDAWPVPATAPSHHAHVGPSRRGVWRLDASKRYRRGDPTHGGPSAEPEDFELCLALLEASIARAERWVARRERALADFDTRAAAMVDQLRRAGVLGAAARWEAP
jgi:hypothetical protein